jgi:hypothetical protein
MKVWLCIFLCLSFWMTNAYLEPPDFTAYYTYTHSLLHDRDLDFSNEYEHFEYQKHMLYVTNRGYLSNDWPMGTGLLWCGFYAAGGVLARLFESKTDGFSPPYIFAILIGILFYVGCGLMSAFYFIEKRYGAKTAFVATFTAFFGTPLLFYTFYGGLMSHATGFFILTIFFIVWGGTIQERTPAQWLLLGALGGLVALVRPQHIASLIVLPVEAFLKYKEGGLRPNTENRRQFLRGCLLALAPFLLGILPLFIYWGKFFGNPFHLPKLEEMHWFRPALYEMLFSDYHGLLPWTPLVLPGALGLLFLWKRERILTAGLLAVLILQIYINSANEIWWAGGSFSNRRFTEYSFIFMVGLAALLGERRGSPWIIVALLLAGWSFLLVIAERTGFNTLDHYIPWNWAFFRGLFYTLFAPWRWLKALWGNFGNAYFLARIGAIFILGALLIITWHLFIRLKISVRWQHIIAGAVLCAMIFINCLVLTGILRTQPLPAEITQRLDRTNRFLWFNYYEYGYYLLVRGRYQKALDAFQKAHALMPTQPQPLRYIGSIYEILEDYDRAEAYYLEAFSLDPKYQNVKVLLERLREKRKHLPPKQLERRI